ncbi:MAG: 50S ribosomal protein L3 [Pseudomonadota bacterium]
MLGVFKKLGMTAIFDDKDSRIAVTLLELPESYILDKIDYGTKISTRIAAAKNNPKKQSKALKTMYTKLNKKPMRILKEFPIQNNLKEGDQLSINSFEKNQYVDIKAKGKGKGFQGVMKRHNFKGQPASHGNTKTQRKGGSTGQCTDPGRVIKGKKMPGRMGGKNVTVQNLQIAEIYPDLNIIAIHGSVPGPIGQYVNVIPAIKKYNLNKFN